MGGKCSACGCNCGLCAAGNAAGIQACRTVGCAECGHGGAAILSKLGDIKQLALDAKRVQNGSCDVDVERSVLRRAYSLANDLRCDPHYKSFVRSQIGEQMGSIVPPKYQNLIRTLSGDNVRTDLVSAFMSGDAVLHDFIECGLGNKDAGRHIVGAIARVTGFESDSSHDAQTLENIFGLFKQHYKDDYVRPTKAGFQRALTATIDNLNKQVSTNVNRSVDLCKDAKAILHEKVCAVVRMLDQLGVVPINPAVLEELGISSSGICGSRGWSTLDIDDVCQEYTYFDLADGINCLVNARLQQHSLPRCLKDVFLKHRVFVHDWQKDAQGDCEGDGTTVPKTLVSHLIKMFREEDQNDLFRCQIQFFTIQQMANFLIDFRAAAQHTGVGVYYKAPSPKPKDAGTFKTYVDLKMYIAFGNYPYEMKVSLWEFIDGDHTHRLYEKNRMGEWLKKFPIAMEQSVVDGSDNDANRTDMAFTVTSNIFAQLAGKLYNSDGHNRPHLKGGGLVNAALRNDDTYISHAVRVGCMGRCATSTICFLEYCLSYEKAGARLVRIGAESLNEKLKAVTAEGYSIHSVVGKGDKTYVVYFTQENKSQRWWLRTGNSDFPIEWKRQQDDDDFYVSHLASTPSSLFVVMTKCDTVSKYKRTLLFDRDEFPIDRVNELEADGYTMSAVCFAGKWNVCMIKFPKPGHTMWGSMEFVADSLANKTGIQVIACACSVTTKRDGASTWFVVSYKQKDYNPTVKWICHGWHSAISAFALHPDHARLDAFAKPYNDSHQDPGYQTLQTCKHCGFRSDMRYICHHCTEFLHDI